MIYGLYLSAAGVIANSYRQDVIANNLANAETDGFKRNTTAFQQRLTEAQLHRAAARNSNPILEGIGGGLLSSPTRTDFTQGEFEVSDNPLDVAIQGKGFVAVDDHGSTRLTRAGNLTLDKDGNLILDNGANDRVLGKDMKPITLDPTHPGQVSISAQGEINQNGKLLATLGMFDVA
ncbi:MAG: flagellar hook basal-body protein, partial [Phycisphaerae bacterium]|nr:flagellar hook basal-body protein [Phycisphaerae bacterium]